MSNFFNPQNPNFVDLSPVASSPKVNRPYDINYAYQQQTQKNYDGTLRMSLSIPSVTSQTGVITFRAHLDPAHVVNDQGKRFVQLDILTGVVMQDFGFNAETIELMGTTGSAYYREIGVLDEIFNAQSVLGQPTVVTLTIESRVYQCAWKGFTNQRKAASGATGTIIEYTMNFVVLSRGTASQTTDNLYQSSVMQATTVENGNIFQLSGSAIIETVSTGGLSPYDYLSAQPDVPMQYLQSALSYVAQAWDVQLNGGVAYPGDHIPLNANQYLTVPTNWAEVL